MAQAIRVQEATRESKEKEVPLMEKIHRYSEAIPECELAKIPSDLSENLDHYIYGAPRKSEDEKS